MSDLAKQLQNDAETVALIGGDKIAIAKCLSQAADHLQEQAERISKLEAENRIFRQTESVDDSVWDALLEQVRQLRAKLKAVEALPDEWRQDEDKCAPFETWRDGNACADELEAIIKEQEYDEEGGQAGWVAASQEQEDE